MSFYSRAIESDFGYSAVDAPRIEAVMRWTHSTLNSLSKAQLRREARIAAALLERVRTEVASGDESGEAQALLAMIEVEARAYA